jgi:hypothetical protein
MKDSIIAKEYTEKLASVKSLPLFASYHQAHLDGKTLKEWLSSQPLELLQKYTEAILFSEDEKDKENQRITEDLMATALLLKAAVTDNKPLEEKEVAKETGFLQFVLTAFSVNKEVKEKWEDDTEVIICNNCTWEEYDKISLQANPLVKFSEEK